MKKIIYFISVLLTCTFLNKNVQAFAWPDFTPLIPFSPQFCVMCIPPAIDWATNTVDQVKDAKNRLKEMTDVTKLKQALTAYAVQLGNAALNYATNKLSAKKKVISSSRVIMDSKREGVDLKNEDSVKVDFVNLFLQYPSNKGKIKSAYRQKGDSIKLDTTLEMYITSKQKLKELCGKDGKGCEIAAAISEDEEKASSYESSYGDLMDSSQKDEMGAMLRISMLESCFMQGKFCDIIKMTGCEPSKDGEESKKEATEQPTEAENNEEDNVCHWKAALDVALIYSDIMRDNEYLIQMLHQYEAVKNIDTLAKIKAAKDGEDKEEQSSSSNTSTTTTASWGEQMKQKNAELFSQQQKEKKCSDCIANAIKSGSNTIEAYSKCLSVCPNGQ